MDARKSKDPRGGAGLLFLAGLGLTAIAALISLRSMSEDAWAAVRDLAETSMDLGKEAAKDTGAAPAATVPTTGDASLTTVAGALDVWVESSRSICWDNLATPSDDGALIAFELTIETDGTVSAARVAGASPALKACLEAEALSWTVPPPSQELTLIRSVRFDPY